MSALHIALYGKGGVGTSTTAANISVALAEAGHRVMQVGFDVSHDSTGVLRGNREVRTILDAVRETGTASTDGMCAATRVCSAWKPASRLRSWRARGRAL